MDAAAERRRRLHRAVIVIVVVLIGLVVHRIDLGLHRVIRDMLGDALWAVMMFHMIRVAFPRAQRWIPTAAALVICFSVEMSQRYHTAWLDEFRATLPGHLILGSGFDPRDFLSYTIGVAAAVGLERATFARRVETNQDSPSR